MFDKVNEERAIRNLPYNYSYILDRGFKIFDWTSTNYPVNHLETLQILEPPSCYILIGEFNMDQWKHPDYKFTNATEFFNALEKYQYACIRRRNTQAMERYYVALVKNSIHPNSNSISRRFRKFINY